MSKVSYQGIFFEFESANIINAADQNKLPIINDELHCTFKPKPTMQELIDELVGSEVEVEFIGYASDGQNSGFEVRFPEEYLPYYINYDETDSSKLKIPHVTASIAEGAEAYKTKDLTFQPLEKTFKVIGKFGYWIKEDDGTEYLSYEPFKTKIK